jgi:hypothetical protein
MSRRPPPVLGLDAADMRVVRERMCDAMPDGNVYRLAHALADVRHAIRRLSPGERAALAPELDAASAALDALHDAAYGISGAPRRSAIRRTPR